MSSTTATATTTTTHNNMTDEELDRDWKPNGRRPQSCVIPRFLIPFLIIYHTVHTIPYHTQLSNPSLFHTHHANDPFGTLHKLARHEQ